MLHLVTAWEAAERKGEPVVLYCGSDRQKAYTAATEADPKFLRVEYCEAPMSFKWNRRIPRKSEIPLPSPSADQEKPSEGAQLLPPINPPSASSRKSK